MEKREELKIKKKGCIIYPIYIFYFWHSPLQHPFSTEGAIFKEPSIIYFVVGPTTTTIA
jgi:hypothetical protein